MINVSSMLQLSQMMKSKRDPYKISKIKLFISKHNWEYPYPSKKYPSKIDDWKMFEKNDPKIALNPILDGVG